jgi:hypothetical protein
MITDLGGGMVRVEQSGVPAAVLQPFGPTWRGPFALAETATRVLVGAGPGGGPRCQQRLRWVAGYPVVADDFLADPNGRSGVVFPSYREDAVALGSGFPVVLSFERPYPGPWAGDVLARVAFLLGGLGLRVRNTRPDDYPGRYGVCVVGAETRNVQPGHPGYAPVGDWATPDSDGPFRANAVYATALTDADQTAADVAHDVLHGLGEVPGTPDGHDDVPGSLMFRGGVYPSSRVTPATAARVRARTLTWRSHR